jgi:hypothetical protein
LSVIGGLLALAVIPFVAFSSRYPRNQDQLLGPW